ncbi:had-superfamily hydrolase subfamily iib protein [Apiospora rasikravindrae]|uniref:Had-superfamily hydrolase subfamily iib protein n=1 Tax=Apiospora rasikravindrae TaxID=990691 RepID=A0ABR1TWH7_9PEZI
MVVCSAVSPAGNDHLGSGVGVGVERMIRVKDLDVTLTAIDALPGSPLPLEAVSAINFLLQVAHVALICRDDWSEVQGNVAAQLASDIPDLTKLWILPSAGTRIFGHRAMEDGSFQCQDRWNLWSHAEVAAIVSALDAALAAKGLAPEEVQGERVEYRGSYIKLHILGRSADPRAKEAWDDADASRRCLVEADMRRRLHQKGLLLENWYRDGVRPDFEVRVVGGGDTIDVVRDETPQRFACYHKLEEITGIPREQMLWVGRSRDDRPYRNQCTALSEQHQTFVGNLGEAIATIRAITACLS